MEDGSDLYIFFLLLPLLLSIYYSQVSMLHRLCALAQIERGSIDGRPGTNIVTRSLGRY